MGTIELTPEYCEVTGLDGSIEPFGWYAYCRALNKVDGPRFVRQKDCQRFCDVIGAKRFTVDAWKAMSDEEWSNVRQEAIACLAW